MKKLATLPPVPLQDRPHIRRLFSKAAMKHPGRMRVILACNILRWVFPDGCRGKYILDNLFGVGTTGLAASIMECEYVYGVELREDWAAEAALLMEQCLEDSQIEFTVQFGNAFTVDYPSEWFDLLLISPIFPNAHPPGESDMQTDLEKDKAVYAGTEFDAGDWEGEENYRKSLAAALRPSVLAVKPGGRILVHIKNYVLGNEVQHADIWTKEVLEGLYNPGEVEVEGYLQAPIADRSFLQNIQRYHNRKVLSRSKLDLYDDLECGHRKFRTKLPAKWPNNARCVDCGPIIGRPEIMEERIVVARRNF